MIRRIIPASVFVVFGVYYALQACPTFYFWDSAELTAAVLLRGVPHPPGFPILLLLANIWASIVPFGKVSGLNLFSAFFAAGGLAVWHMVIARTLRQLFKKGESLALSIISLIPILVLGISFSYGIQATRFEVYSLNFFLFALLFYLALRLIESGGESILWNLLFYGVMGISLGAHILTMALAIPGIVLLLYTWSGSRISRPAMGIPVAAVSFLAVYYFLFSLARSHPALNWGDPSSLGRFIDYFFVREFDVSTSSFSKAHIAANLTFASRVMSNQFGIIGIAVALAGLGYMFFRRITLAVAVSMILMLNVFSSIFSSEYFYENFDLHGYYTIGLGVVAMCAAAGLTLLYTLLWQRKRIKKYGRVDSRALLVTAVVSIFVFAIPIWDNVFSANLSSVDGARYAELFLNESPENAVVLTSYYNTYFCLMAYDSAYDRESKRVIQCVYNWDHPWGRRQAASALNAGVSTDLDRQSFYKELLNGLDDKSRLYIEYDIASRPIVQYLVPQGMGYVYAPDDTTTAGVDVVRNAAEMRLAQAEVSDQVEWVKTWTYWFNNRGLYYLQRGQMEAADAYFAAMGSVASETTVE